MKLEDIEDELAQCLDKRIWVPAETVEELKQLIVDAMKANIAHPNKLIYTLCQEIGGRSKTHHRSAPYSEICLSCQDHSLECENLKNAAWFHTIHLYST
ncbi:hypothetical protein RRG08_057747 [Elysia crispata]|uniref:Uncharacterized protein n=1 Tax=Elysia crispata TaxID=231223 RepID=A0AAE1CZF4_9GAST|nr:hypothetical protein RRG08_057747 [Elysia crispata]